jgi:hypothetical protein
MPIHFSSSVKTKHKLHILNKQIEIFHWTGIHNTLPFLKEGNSFKK